MPESMDTVRVPEEAMCLCCCRSLSDHNAKRQCQETTYFLAAPTPPAVSGVREALVEAGDILESYIGFLHRMPADDLELHPYIPAVEQAFDKVSAALASLAPDGSAGK
jgi:hypothetical protein